MMRLQKFLSHAGCCSRRQGDKYIASGRVKVNGTIITRLGTQIDPDSDTVEFDGQAMRIPNRQLYIALNKPAGYVTSCRQPGERIVMTLIDIAERVYPIGRLDRDSTGLLLLTNNGALHHKLSHPSFDHEKEYEVILVNHISDEDIRKLSCGIRIDDYMTRSANVVRTSENSFRIILQEGKKRQIRRMAEAVGNRVSDLKRTRIDCIRLGALPVGAWRYLTQQEEMQLLKISARDLV